MPDLSALGRVDFLSGDHGSDALSDTSIPCYLSQQLQTARINLRVRVVEPDLVKNFEPECLITSLVLKEVAQVGLLRDSGIVLLKRLH